MNKEKMLELSFNYAKANVTQITVPVLGEISIIPATSGQMSTIFKLEEKDEHEAFFRLVEYCVVDSETLQPVFTGTKGKEAVRCLPFELISQLREEIGKLSSLSKGAAKNSEATTTDNGSSI